MFELINILYSQSIIELLIFSSVFIAIFTLVLSVFPDERQAAMRKRLGVVEESLTPQKTTLLKWLRPIYAAITPLLYSNSAPPFWLEYLQNKKPSLNKKLIAANLREEISPDEFMGLKFVMSVVILIMSHYVLSILGMSLGQGAWLIALLAGFMFPDLWLAERLLIRRKSILKPLPYTIDLLTLSVEAGLDFVGAISRFTQKARPNALLEELALMLKEIRLGTSRSDALRNMSHRLQIEEITSLTTLLIQADQLGASIGQVLRAQSDQLRSKRFQHAETAGAKASQLILFPLIFCILPAAIIILLGPTIISLMQGGFF